MIFRQKTKSSRWLTLVLTSSLLIAGIGHAEFREKDLNAKRLILAGDWLRLKLEVMGLRLSYPAYRIQLELDEENLIVFTFLASGGLAEHLTEKAEKEAAEEMMSYHATGIRDQIGQLLKDEFPDLWGGFDAKRDFRGTFMGPGEKWDDPPRTLGFWQEDQFSWK